MEDELFQEAPYIQMPFVTLASAHDAPVAISAQRDSETGALWVLLRDVSEEAAVQERLVHQHNALSLAHRELAAARDAALSADKAKTRFLANVSHELRTPLNVVIGGRAETGNLIIHEEWCQPAAIIDEMVRLARGLPEAKGLEIVFRPDEQQPELYADPRRVCAV